MRHIPLKDIENVLEMYCQQVLAFELQNRKFLFFVGRLELEVFHLEIQVLNESYIELEAVE